MSAILKRELSSYFKSPIAYVVLAIYYFITGLLFTLFCISSNSSSLQSIMTNWIFLLLIAILIPIITMKSFAEEKRQKTDQILLTSPVSLFEIVFGKFLAAFIIYACCVAIFIVYTLIICIFTTPNFPIILLTILGLLLLGAAIISINIFFSCLTQYQIISVFSSLGINLFILLFIDALGSMISSGFITKVINKISFTLNFSSFTQGILNIANIVFFLSVTAIFIFLTIRVIDKRRYS